MIRSVFMHKLECMSSLVRKIGLSLWNKELEIFECKQQIPCYMKNSDGIFSVKVFSTLIILKHKIFNNASCNLQNHIYMILCTIIWNDIFAENFFRWKCNEIINIINHTNEITECGKSELEINTGKLEAWLRQLFNRFFCSNRTHFFLV